MKFTFYDFKEYYKHLLKHLHKFTHLNQRYGKTDHEVIKRGHFSLDVTETQNELLTLLS